MINLLAKFLARPAVFEFISLHAGRSFGHLYDKTGTLYMGRWSVIDEGTRASKLLKFFTGYASIRLHWINRADLDRDLHNHPFTYRTFVLKGWYQEETRGDLVTFYRRVGAGQTVRNDGFHRIARVSDGGVWTLFCMTPNTGEWGFDVSGRFVPSKVYFKARGDK